MALQNLLGELALDATLTNGEQQTQIVDGVGNVISSTGNKLDVNATVDTSLLATSAKQLADGHNVAVNNFPSEYPLSAAQVSTLTPPAAITGFATSAKQLADNHQVTVSNIASVPVITGFATETTLGTVHGHVDSIDTKTPALGQALAAASVPVVLTSAQLSTLTPAAQGLTDTQLRNTAVPIIAGGNIAHDSADSGNPIKMGGRASTTPVTAVAANDRVDGFFDVQGRQVVVQKALTGTITSVNSSASNVTLLAANTARLGATFLNLSTAILYLKLGATATATTSYTVKMQPDDYYEIPFGYYGIVDGIWSAANGYVNVTEIT